MFRCQRCDTVVPAGTRANKIVVQTRRKEYESRGPDPSERTSRFQRGRRTKRKRKKYDQGGTGHEIVREIMVCPTCADELNAELAQQQAAQQQAAEQEQEQQQEEAAVAVAE